MKKSTGFPKLLAYARFVLAGGIGGVAVINTYGMLMANNPSPSAETIAMAVGAATLAGLAKLVHAV